MKKEHKEAYKILLDTYGLSNQLRICIEEMSELTKELCKYERMKECGDSNKIEEIKQNIIQEVADVLVTAEQMELIFGYDEVEKVRDMKIARAISRIDS